jgi:hypothetical protein
VEALMFIVQHKVHEVITRIRLRFRSRILEWEHATVATLWGLIILGNPSVFAGPAFVAFKGGPILWGWLVFLLGVARITALCINGYMAKPTALVRALGAVIGIGLFAALTLGLLMSWTWPPGLAVYGTLCVFGLFSIYWAIFDVAIPDGHDDHAT